MPMDYTEMGFMIAKQLMPIYSLSLIVSTTILVFAIVIIVSYLPSRRIAKMKPTDALRENCRMMYFLIKGLLRDRSRSLFPVIIITITVYCYFFNRIHERINELCFPEYCCHYFGHEKVVTRAYKEESQMLPNDLALLDVDQIIRNLEKNIQITFGVQG